MKIINYLVGAFIAVSVIGCGNKNKTSEEDGKIILTPETTHIKGDLGDYFEVVEKEYTVTDDWGDMVTVEVVRTDTPYAFDIEGVDPYGTSGRDVKGHAGFGIEILDENGNVIEKTSATASGMSGMYSSNDMKEALHLKPGETGVARWTFRFDKENKPVKFRLTSAYETVDSSNWDSSSSSEDNTGYYVSDEDGTSSFDDSDDEDDSRTSYGSSSGSSENWDAILNSYDSYVNKLISYAKKVSKGDTSAMAEYASLLQEAQEYSAKMQNAQGSMSAAQWARYMKITNKMSTAISQMH